MLDESDCPAADGPHLGLMAARLGLAIADELVEAEIEVVSAAMLGPQTRMVRYSQRFQRKKPSMPMIVASIRPTIT
jgi:hypothetical protein